MSEIKITEFNHRYQAVSCHFLPRDFFTIPSSVFFSSFTYYISECVCVFVWFWKKIYLACSRCIWVFYRCCCQLPSHKDANHFGSFIKNSCVSLPLTFFWGSSFFTSISRHTPVLLFGVQHRFSFYALYLLQQFTAMLLLVPHFEAVTTVAHNTFATFHHRGQINEKLYEKRTHRQRCKRIRVIPPLGILTNLECK